jgi:predicted nucleic acid-binding protein
LSTFVDSSAWFASVVARDRNNARARSILLATGACVTTDHVLAPVLNRRASGRKKGVVAAE